MSGVEKADFLFELYSEEIPAAYQPGVVRYWESKLPGLLREQLIAAGEIKIMATPRRLVVQIANLPACQDTREEVLKGPPKHLCFTHGNPTPALQGFAAKVGLPIEQVNFTGDAKGEYAIATVRRGGQPTLPLVGNCLAEMISSTPFPRSMRWGNHDFLYARPLLSYLAVYGRERITFDNHALWHLLPPVAGTIPHFILHRQQVPISSTLEYEQVLSAAGILIDQHQRKETIRQQLLAVARQADGTPVIDDALLSEVTWLVERPTVVLAEFPREFLQLPECVILSEMQGHQRYFGIRLANGKLSHKFLIVSNGAAEDAAALANIRAGNIRVLRARLEDGAFFYREDRKRPLVERIPDLKKIGYQENLGSMFDKAERLTRHAASLQQLGIFAHLPGEQVRRAALLCKADLTTQLVYEFDHLQGEIGSIYAAQDGEPEEVSRAIFEHYLPRSQDDDYPQSPLGVLLSLADKLDNVCAGFLLGKQPTSSADPFGLRRQVIYVLELIIRNRLSFSFPRMLEMLLQNFSPLKQADAATAATIWEFVRARFVTVFEKEGFDKNLIRAGIFSGSEDIFDLFLRMAALKRLKKSGDEQSLNALLLSFKRMSNILADYSKKYPNEKITEEVSAALFQEQEEHNLLALSQWLREKAAGCRSEEDYTAFFRFLAAEKKTVDQFFDKVMVMHDNPEIRNNRLALLRFALNPVAALLDLSQLSA